MNETPPRLYRFVQHGTMPCENILWLYDNETNLLLINQQHYDKLNPSDQRKVLNTTRGAGEIMTDPRGETRLALT